MAGGMCVLAAAVGSAAWRWASAPRVWRPGEARVAFWAWRAETPSEEDVARVAHATGARAIFLRAGQFDVAAGKVSRIRAVAGTMPRGVELHLVYNGTRALLAEFERVDEKVLAAAVAETFRRDRERAGRDGASVSGLQLDFDSPTRLLARYALILRSVREQLPPEIKLSVTGLPTWMNAAELTKVLAAVDFWAPQFYGAEIPARLERLAPISSPRLVARDAARARQLGVPFYAGLAAYGYALLYSEKGELLALRGDLDPARVARSRDFELVERRAFEPEGGEREGPRASEWRYVYRAHADTTADGLAVRGGERIVFNLPSSESLRASVRGVREQAGEQLLGILLFRLPTRGDAVVLNLRQIASALADAEAEAGVSLRAERGKRDALAGGDGGHLSLTVINIGAAEPLFGDGALSLTLGVPRGSVRGVVSLEGFDSFETLCGAAKVEGAAEASSDVEAVLRPCSSARASFVRLKASNLKSGARADARLSFVGELPPASAATVRLRLDDGRVWRREQALEMTDETARQQTKAHR